MKIRKIEIENFGKLSNFTCTFSDGLNIIEKPNEYGKTTIMSFIYMMFYSKLPNEGSSDIQKSLRKKYRPWNQGKMAGRIEFLSDGVTYSLYKNFGKSIGSDEIQLIRLDTGEEIKINKDEEMGRRFFGLDAAGFEKSVFISCTGGFTGEGSADIAVRLSNIISAGDETVAGSVVQKRITDARENLVSKSGKKGSLTELKNQCADVEQKKKENAEQNELIEEKERKIDELRNINSQFNITKCEIDRKLKAISNSAKLPECIRIDELSKESKKLQPEIDIEKSTEAMNDILLENNIYKEKSAAFNDELIVIDEDEYLNFTKNVKQRDTASNIKEFIENSIMPASENLKVSEKRLEELNAQEPIKGKSDFTLFIIGILFIAASVIPVIIGKYIFTAVIGVIAIALVIIGILKMNKTKSQNAELTKQYFASKESLAVETGKLKAREDEMLRMLAEKMKTGVITDLNKAINDNADLLYSAEESINKFLSDTGYKEDEIPKAYAASAAAIESRKSINELQKKILNKQNDFTRFINNYKTADNYEEATRIYNEEIQKYEKQQKIGEQLKALSDSSLITQEEAGTLKDKLQAELDKENIQTENIQQLKHDLTNERTEIESKIEANNELLFELGKQLNTGMEDEEVLNTQINEMRSEIKDMSSYYDALVIAEKYMKQSVDEAGSTFGPELNKRTSEIFSKLTENRYNTLMVDKEYKISVKEEVGAFHEWKYLSNGTIDQAYFALRLALTGIVTEGEEKLPLLLDDVFIQYDGERKKQAMDFIKEYSKDSQVIYFKTI